MENYCVNIDGSKDIECTINGHQLILNNPIDIDILKDLKIDDCVFYTFQSTDNVRYTQIDGPIKNIQEIPHTVKNIYIDDNLKYQKIEKENIESYFQDRKTDILVIWTIQHTEEFDNLMKSAFNSTDITDDLPAGGTTYNIIRIYREKLDCKYIIVIKDSGNDTPDVYENCGNSTKQKMTDVFKSIDVITKRIHIIIIGHGDKNQSHIMNDDRTLIRKLDKDTVFINGVVMHSTMSYLQHIRKNYIPILITMYVCHSAGIFAELLAARLNRTHNITCIVRGHEGEAKRLSKYDKAFETYNKYRGVICFPYLENGYMYIRSVS